MTPAEVRRLSVPEYLAFLRRMDEERRANEKAAKRRR
jgi:hypothetical protein